MDNESRFKILFNETGVGITLVNLDRVIIDVNPAFEKLIGYTRVELLGRTFAGILYPEDSALNLELHKELLNGQRDVYHMERRYIRKEGSLLWTRLTVSIVRDENGKPEFTMGMIEDITDTKNAQAKLAEQHEAVVRNAKLSALGEMAGGVAHEIETPLTTIRLRAEEMKALSMEPGLAPETANRIAHSAQSIEKTVLRISAIVKGLRAIAKQGENDPFKRLSLNRLIEETLELCRNKFRFQNMELRFDKAEDFEISCRPTQVSQVLINLLDNAYDAIQDLPEKWVRVSVKDLGDGLEVWVEDSGPRIPKELAERLFKSTPFMAKPSTVDEGVDLNICLGIMQSHGGNLRVDSDAPHTKLVLTFPEAKLTRLTAVPLRKVA